MSQGAQSGTGRPREERRRVMLPARMRSASGWSDACILNISSRGLLVFSSGSATPGSFVEVRRGGQLVVARVVWRKNQRIGLCSPDPVRVEDIISSQTAASAVQATAARPKFDRRCVPRSADRSRSQARAMEFMGTLLVGSSIVLVAAVYAVDVLARPMLVIRAALGTS
jgi:hypothetical protein